MVCNPLMDAKPVKEVFSVAVSEDTAKTHSLSIHKQRIGKRSVSDPEVLSETLTPSKSEKKIQKVK